MLAWTRENMIWSQKYGNKDTVRGGNRNKYQKRRGGKDGKNRGGDERVRKLKLTKK